MAETEEHMAAYLSTAFAGARSVRVGRLRKNVCALSAAYRRIGFLRFFHKLDVLQSRPRINIASNDAPKIIPYEGLGNCIG